MVSRRNFGSSARNFAALCLFPASLFCDIEIPLPETRLDKTETGLQSRRKNVASIMYEDHAILAMRVRRLFEARALVLTPMPRSTHLISNIEVTSDAPDQYVAEAFIYVEHQNGREHLYSGRHTHHLVRRNGSFHIALKRVALLDCDGKHSTMTIPI
jgi:3-phenylpropionate/cinnamic acid dioxygenase small subunit